MKSLTIILTFFVSINCFASAKEQLIDEIRYKNKKTNNRLKSIYHNKDVAKKVSNELNSYSIEAIERIQEMSEIDALSVLSFKSLSNEYFNRVKRASKVTKLHRMKVFNDDEVQSALKFDRLTYKAHEKLTKIVFMIHGQTKTKNKESLEKALAFVDQQVAYAYFTTKNKKKLKVIDLLKEDNVRKHLHISHVHGTDITLKFKKLTMLDKKMSNRVLASIE